MVLRLVCLSILLLQPMQYLAMIRRTLSCALSTASMWPFVMFDATLSRSFTQPVRLLHLQRTAENYRQNEMFRATVLSFKQISPSVKQLTLKINDCGTFSFKAGQWVDFTIPDVSIVGGYSMCSAPFEAVENGVITLAVKESNHAPAFWVHNKCRIGSEVQIRVGGDFFFDPSEHPSTDLLLIAGGVGINPLMSIVAETLHSDSSAERHRQRRLALLYSAGLEDELIFKDELEAVASKHSNFSVAFFVTNGLPLRDSHVNRRRILPSDLTVKLKQLNVPSVKVFLCGPPTMTDSLRTELLDLNISDHQIVFEKWW